MVQIIRCSLWVQPLGHTFHTEHSLSPRDRTQGKSLMAQTQELAPTRLYPGERFVLELKLSK